MPTLEELTSEEIEERLSAAPDALGITLVNVETGAMWHSAGQTIYSPQAQPDTSHFWEGPFNLEVPSNARV